jgi:hypothetical protein
MTEPTKQWQHGVLASHGEFLTFDDANLGHMACIRNWNDDGPWLFRLGANGEFVSYRRADHKDCAALGVPDWMYVKRKVRQG